MPLVFLFVPWPFILALHWISYFSYYFISPGLLSYRLWPSARILPSISVLFLGQLSQLYFEVYSPLCIIPSLCLFCCGVFFSVVVVFFGYLVIPVYLGIFVNERLGLLVMSFVCFYNLCVSPVLITGQTPQKEALYGSVSLCSWKH